MLVRVKNEIAIGVAGSLIHHLLRGVPERPRGGVRQRDFLALDAHHHQGLAIELAKETS